VLAENVHELKPNRVAQGLGDPSEPLCALALHVGIYDGRAAGLAGGALLLGRELKIDGHLSIYID
jgi:hypothetical protein